MAETRASSFSHSPSQRAPLASNRDVLILEITRGKTRNPLRPVLSDRFLIGSAAACDLTLAGSVPSLHSVIVAEDGGYRWESLCEQSLIHNGRSTRSTLLTDGDTVVVGEIELTARIVDWSTSRQIESQDDSPQPDTPIEDSSPVPSAADMSAAELVDRLEQEIQLVEQFESRRQLGLEALLQAAAKHVPAAEAKSEHAQPVSDAQVVQQQLGKLVSRLNSCVSSLEERAGEIARERINLAETIALAIQRERELIDRLHALLDDGHTHSRKPAGPSLSAA